MLFKEKLKKIRPSRFYTLILVPHSEGNVRKFKVPGSFVKIAVIVSACCLLVGSFCLFNYLNMKKNMVELNTLRSVNKTQEAKLQSLETETSKLKTKMAEVNDLENSIKEMLKDNKLSSRSDSSSERRIVISSSSEKTEKKGLKAIAQMNYRLEENEKQAEILNVEIENSTKELTDLKEQLAKKISYLRAKPTGWPVQGRISSQFGYRSSPFGGGKREFHDGLDIAAPYGTPVLAPCDGKIIYAGYKAILGKTVMIKSNYGFQTVFGHNSKIKVKVGDTVTRGDCISYVGNTGRSTGPHLHYEVWVSGEKVNPMDYIIRDSSN